MGSQLHQALRSLCFNTEWNYAVFWKHRTRMMLTWEDAYYDNHERHNPSENKWFTDIVGNLRDGYYSHDSLLLAVAKMSYHVYSLGEGIVGQVAVTGKHQWISADKHVTDSCSPFKYCDGWKTQFSAGIRTIAVVAVVPHGVVQLGSLNKLAEDLKLLSRIRDIFFELQDSLAGHICSVIPSSMESSSCLSDVAASGSDSRICHDYIRNLDKTMKDMTNIWSPRFPSFGKPGDRSYFVPIREGYPKKTVEMVNKNGEQPENSMPGVGVSVDLLQSNSEVLLTEQRKQVHTKLVIDSKCQAEPSGFRDVGLGSEDNDTPSSHDFIRSKFNLYNVTLPADNSGVYISYYPSNFLDSAPFFCDYQNGVLRVPEPFNVQIQKDPDKNLELQTEINHKDRLKTSFSFSAGCELYEALGPAFQEQNTCCDWQTEKTETETVTEMAAEGMSSGNLLTANSCSEHLLEAVVANVCHSCTDVKVAKSFCKSVPSVLTTEKVLETPSSDMPTTGSADYSYDWSSCTREDTLHCLNSSVARGVESSESFSPARPSRCSEQLGRPQEPAKLNKKRARPGENCRPRPRDRQLIQVRIKELREIVPNGSKCSIDSLLERTIKHMLFMQGITKHADKLDKCVESKLLDKDTVIRGSSSYEQDSSWAIEVGTGLKICPIIVENINLKGQMLVEMLCEDCSHFLEIAEAIRSLGLTILKGVTETCAEKTWICFVVENKRSMHRMDILWSLVQILQSKMKT